MFLDRTGFREEKAMTLKYVDYSKLWYCKINNVQVPHHRSGKFIVVTNDGNLWCILSPRDMSKYHANIAERFLNERSVSGEYDSSHAKYTPSQNDWVIEGGGKWEINEEQGLLVIYDSSQAYGRLDLKSLADRLLKETDFTDVISY